MDNQINCYSNKMVQEINLVAYIFLGLVFTILNGHLIGKVLHKELFCFSVKVDKVAISSINLFTKTRSSSPWRVHFKLKNFTKQKKFFYCDDKIVFPHKFVFKLNSRKDSSKCSAFCYICRKEMSFPERKPPPTLKKVNKVSVTKRTSSTRPLISIISYLEYSATSAVGHST